MNEVVLVVLGSVLGLTSVANVGLMFKMSRDLGRVCEKVEKHETSINHIQAACPLCPKER